MPTFASSDRRVVTIRAPKDRVVEALSRPERVQQSLAADLEASQVVDASTLHLQRKPVEEKGVKFRADYTVRYAYDGSGKITWSTVGTGNMRSNGEALIAANDDGSTRVDYRESIECDMEVNRILAAVLRPIVERKIKSGVGDYLARVKAGLERAA